MGFFRHSSVSVSTATIPASTTLSARPRFTRRTSLATASALTCAGVFYVAAVNAGSNPAPTASGARPTTQSSVQFEVNQQASDDTTTNLAPEPSAGTSQTTTTSINATTSGTSPGSTSVTVNGQPVAIPPSGTVNKTIVDDNGQTSLEVHASSEGSTLNSSSTTLNVNVNSSSTSFDNNSP